MTNPPLPGIKAATKVTPYGIPARVKKEDLQTSESLPPDVKEQRTQLTNEDVTVAGKIYACKVYQITTEESDITGIGKAKGFTFHAGASSYMIWVCPQVPGRLVKIQHKPGGPSGDSGNAILTVIDAK